MPSRSRFGVFAARLLLAFVWFTSAAHAAVPSEDGIYATFVVSRAGAPVGEFTCRLEYRKAPRTVASFVGLAEGSRAWVDFRRGGVRRKPFYDGITFHRVVLEPTPFVIQAGSPNGQGNDGPGYAFHDEFHPDLRHSKAGILSMANSGEDTNGSQFFVTLAATSHLDDVHSVFGETATPADLDVVNLVRQGDVIDSVTITRNGAEAQSFDVNAQGLPTVSDAEPVIARNQSGFELNYEKRIDSEYYVFHTADFSTWEQVLGSEFYVEAPSQTPRDVSTITSGQDRRFFSVAVVQYVEESAATVVEGKRITVYLTGGGTFAFNLQRFSPSIAGTFTTSLIAGTFPIYTYTVTASSSRNRLLTTHRVRFDADIAGFSLGNPSAPLTGVDINLDFNNSTSGTVSGILSTETTNYSLPGIFTVSDL